MDPRLVRIFLSTLLLLASLCSCSNKEANTGLGSQDVLLQVESTIPEAEATDVPVDIVISVFMSIPLTLSLDPENPILIFDLPGSTSIQDNVISFRPDQSLQPLTEYRVTINPDVISSGEQKLREQFSWTFSTAQPDTLPGFPEPPGD